MLIGYLFDNRLLRFKEDSTFLLLRTNVRTFDCPKIFDQKYLPRLSGPETKNLSFPLSVFLLSGFSMCCIKFHLCKKLKTGQVRFIRVMKEKKIFSNHYKARKAKNMACAI